MPLNQNWHSALDRAQEGDLAPAVAAHAEESASPLAEYFFARCLTEAPPLRADQYPEAIERLTPIVQSQPTNPVFVQTLILALLRGSTPDSLRQAAALLRSQGLPHDLDLLGQMAITLELQMRPLPYLSSATAIPWPRALPQLEQAQSAPTSGSIATSAESDKLSPALASNSSGHAVESTTTTAAGPSLPPLPELPQRRRPSPRVVRRLEKLLVEHSPLHVLEQVGTLLDRNQEGPDMQLLAGIAAEEVGEAIRARAHLARAGRLAPTMLLVRSQLARVYWRLDWLDLAIALWRSLPIEGPYDYGRHYHLGLAYATAGDYPFARATMRRAMTDFFYDSRHFYIKRILERWLAAHSERELGADRKHLS